MDENIVNNPRRQFLMYMGLIGCGLLVSACMRDQSEIAQEVESTKQAPPVQNTVPSTTDEGSPAQDNHPVCADTAAIIYLNPGHIHTTVNLTQEEINSAVVQDYFLLKGSHAHSFSLTEEDFMSIRQGQVIQKEDNEGHGHMISIMCK